MSSAPDSIAAGTALQHYRLIERLGGAAQTWIAEDTRNGNRVAVKILSRLIPKDKGSRDAVLKQLRLKAAVGHPGLANITQLDIDQDVLWMASELVEGESLSRRAQREKASKTSFLRNAWQMADTLAAVHAAGIVLGQINGESWIITPDGDVKLVSFRFSSFMGKHETGQTLLSTIKPANLREAAYLSPEQITGKMVTSRTDIFALGVCLYEMIAGTVPFHGASVSDVAQAVSTSAPAAPQNPAIDRSLLGPVGKCIQKNPDSRYEKIAFLKDDLAKIAPDVESIARRRGVTSPGGISIPRKASTAVAADTFIVVGELPYHELLRSKEPDRAGSLENTMQQYLGEAVYLFDGKVLDSFGPMMVASMPDGESAIRAAQKGLSDLVEHNMTHGHDPVEARMLIHYGELVPTAGKPEGSGLTTAMNVLDAMEPLQLLVSRPVIERVDVEGEPVPIGSLAGFDLYRPPKLREPEPELPVTPNTAAPAGERHPAATVPGPVSTSTPESPARKPPGKKGRSLAVAGVIAVLVLVVGVLGAVFVLKRGGDAPPVAVAPPPPVEAAPAKPAIDPNKIYFEGFRIDVTVAVVETSETAAETVPDPAMSPATPEMPAVASDPELGLAAVDLQAAVSRIMALDSSLVVYPHPADDARRISGRLTRAANGIALTPLVAEGETESENPAIDVRRPVAAALAYVRSVWPTLGRNLDFIPGDDAAVESYLEASALQEKGELARALAAVAKIIDVQGDFIAARRLHIDLLVGLDRKDEAIEASKRLAILDPKDTTIRKRLAEWEISRGNPGYGLVWLGEILAVEPDNVEILTRIGQYATAVGNEEKFTAILRRQADLRVENPRLSEGDLFLSRGRLDAAAKKYYEDLNTQTDNPVLGLKIGRLAVIRRSDLVIEAEIERLTRLQSPFELAMMQAYIAANDGDVDAAELALRRAEEAASPLDPVYTASAEVYLLLNRQKQVLEALEKALGRAEPTHDYILSNPIFGYLAGDPSFRNVLRTIDSQRAQISAALDSMDL